MATTPQVLPPDSTSQPSFDPNDPWGSAQFGATPPEPIAATPPPAPATPPAAPGSEAWFLEIAPDYRYKTPEAAKEGYLEAQRTIQSQKAELQRFKDFVAGNPTSATPQADPFLTALEQSVKAGGDRSAFQRTLGEYVQAQVQQQLQTVMQPLQPVVGQATFTRAVEIAASMPNGDPNIPNFVRSPQFQTVLSQWPTLGEAIQTARYDPSFMEKQLPEMLALAYRVAAMAAPPSAPIPSRQLPSSSTPGNASVTVPPPQGTTFPGQQASPAAPSALDNMTIDQIFGIKR